MPPSYRRVGQGPHTPGPWHVGPGYPEYYASSTFTTVISDAPDGLSTTDPQNVAAYGGNLVAESVAHCNAHLIAAAPDLLAAVMTAFDYLVNPIGCRDEVIAALWEAYKKGTGMAAARNLTEAE